jgi:hypothetical protein
MIYWTFCEHCKQYTGSHADEMARMTKEIWYLTENRQEWQDACEKAWERIKELENEL